jgi:Flp pilus assembly protein TadG
MKKFSIGNMLAGQEGTTLILIALCLPVFLGVAALALDIGHLVVTKNELQNAADSGALAGARDLYKVNPDNTLEANLSCTTTAINTAQWNKSNNITVDSVEAVRGHWKLSNRSFDATYKDLFEVPILHDITEQQLDDDIKFINAVKVTAYRKASMITAWFAGFLGFPEFQQSADAIAYVGYAGEVEQFKADAPIAICNTALGNPYTCKWGRMINDGNNKSTAETGGWTDLTQPDPCGNAANKPDIEDRVKGMSCVNPPSTGTNQVTLTMGGTLRMNNGEVQKAFSEFSTCWDNAADKDGKFTSWPLTLPVIDCTLGFDSNCNKVVGGVKVEIVWINPKNDVQYNDLEKVVSMKTSEKTWTPPKGMKDQALWNNFATSFGLTDKSGTPLAYQAKTIYFLPSCQAVEPMGGTGGNNFGILAKKPVLVE